MQDDPDWRDVSVEHEGVRLLGKYLPEPFLQVHMMLPFERIAVWHMRQQPSLSELPALVEETLIGIYDTCLWAAVHQQELRERYRPVIEAGETSDEYMSFDRYTLAELALEESPNISLEEHKSLMAPLDVRLKAWNDLRAKTLQRALDDLGHSWPHALQVLSRLAPHFDPTLAATLRR
jgi:hypothetical protein